jgi:hypothetical protein
MKKTWLFIAATPLLSPFLFGCVARIAAPPPHGIYAPGPPPDPIVEVRPAIPFPDAVWIGGWWIFSDGRWVWTPGRWERRPHPRAHWHPGYWHYEGPRGWVYRPGYWR